MIIASDQQRMCLPYGLLASIILSGEVVPYQSKIRNLGLIIRVEHIGENNFDITTASIECACLRFSRRTQPSPYQATTPPIRPVPFTSAANRRDPRRAAFCVTPATRWSTRVVSDLVRGSDQTRHIIVETQIRIASRGKTRAKCPNSLQAGQGGSGWPLPGVSRKRGGRCSGVTST
ncbi:unnamed protein product, partial [Trichogramma brassicae]